jgi:IS605 OrfB family transposase
MRRTSRVYLNDLNPSKSMRLRASLLNYSNALNYVIHKIWPSKDFSSELLDKSFTDNIRERFGVTARLAQCIAKQAKECVNSQRKKSRRMRRIPRFHHPTACLDSRFATIEVFEGSFDMCLKLSSGLPKIVVPFNRTKHTNKFMDDGWVLGKSIRLGYNENGLFLDLVFEKERPPKRTDGKVLGIDRGFNSMLYTSDDQQIGIELKPKIKSAGKRRKSYHHFIETEENRHLKQLMLDGVRTVVLEDLKYVKHKKRGKFSRSSNRLLSFWHYAKVGRRANRLCEEQGVSAELKDPWKTSQRCPSCGNIDRRNRSGERFKCRSCGHEDNADHVGALNLEALGLAGVYSLRSLPSGFLGTR